MAIVTNTLLRYDVANSIREDLANVIYNISPVDVPFMSNIGRESAKSTYTEWQVDALAAASSTNAQLEGDDIVGTTDSRAATNRVGNYTQISRKIVSTSGTTEAVDMAGKKSELAYQLAKAASELKRDMETILCSDQAAVVGNSTVARKTGALGCWLITNSTLGGGTVAAQPAMSSSSDGYPATAVVAGTTVTFTVARLKTMIQNVWTQGGDINKSFVMAGPVNKQIISGFAGISTLYTDAVPGKQASIVGAADIYVSDFGKVNIVPNRFQLEKNVYLVNPDYAAVSYLRPFQTVVMAKTGDAEKRMLIAEYALKVRAQKSMGVVRDCTTS